MGRLFWTLPASLSFCLYIFSCLYYTRKAWKLTRVLEDILPALSLCLLPPIYLFSA
jgi:hypothetical protein